LPIWSIKLPLLRPTDYTGDIAVEGGVLMLITKGETEDTLDKAYAPGSWEYVERKPSPSGE